jgi:hypothetical protein
METFHSAISQINVRRVPPSQFIADLYNSHSRVRIKCGNGEPLRTDSLNVSFSEPRDFAQGPRFLVEFSHERRSDLNSLDNCFVLTARSRSIPNEMFLMSQAIRFEQGLILRDSSYYNVGNKSPYHDTERIGVYFDKDTHRYLVVDGLALPKDTAKLFHAGEYHPFWVELEGDKSLPPNVLDFSTFKP